MRTDMGFPFVIASEAKQSRNASAEIVWIASSQGLLAMTRRECAPRDDEEGARRSYFLSLKYGSTGPCTLMVSGLPWRSLALPAVTRTQPSLMQYSSTLVFSTPLKRMPTSRESISAL